VCFAVQRLYLDDDLRCISLILLQLRGYTPLDLKYRVQFIIVVDYLLAGSNHDSIVEAADHVTKNINKKALILHLYEVHSLRLVDSPGEYVDQDEDYDHRDVELEITSKI